MHTLTKGLSVRLHLSLKHTHLRNPVYQILIFRHLFSTRPRWSVKASLPTAHSNSSLAPRLGPIGFFPVLEYSDEQLWWGSELGFSFLFACMDTSHLDSSMTVLYPVFVLVPFVTDKKTTILYWWFKWFLRETYSQSCMHIYWTDFNFHYFFQNGTGMSFAVHILIQRKRDVLLDEFNFSCPSFDEMGTLVQLTVRKQRYI